MLRSLPTLAALAFTLVSAFALDAGGYPNTHSGSASSSLTLASSPGPNRSAPAAPTASAATPADDLPFPRNYEKTPSCREFVTHGTVNGKPAKVEEACRRIGPAPLPR